MSRSIPPTVQRIVDEVAARHGITSAEIFGRRRPRHIAWPRQEVFALIRSTIVVNGSPASYPLIGLWMGFNHATVIHGARRHGARYESGGDLTFTRDASYKRRLAIHHGEKKALAITKGQDAAAEADVATWTGLGNGRRAA